MSKSKFSVTKTYGPDLGISAAFRQWRTDSHCQYLHGYALGFALTFECDYLDINGWVLDFGRMKDLKAQLLTQFDHKTLVAQDDPTLPFIREMHQNGILNLKVMERVGCEAFAKWVHETTQKFLIASGEFPRVTCVAVTCSEHGANSATYDLRCNP